MSTKENLINDLIKGGYLRKPLLIEAFEKIDRADFVPESFKKNAYLNQPLSIGFGQTISQPLTVAFMLELLDPKPGEKILDIGSGSGWQTSLLAYCVASSAEKSKSGSVIAIERIKELKEMTEKNAAKYNFIKKGIVKVILGDGSAGYAKGAPYDKIIAAAATQEMPSAWPEELKIGGRLVAPFDHSIIVLDKISRDGFEKKEFFGFSFVPLIKE